MPDASRVPKSIPQFNAYITRTALYLFAGSPANGERLGITLARANEWAARQAAWKLLYASYGNVMENTSVVKKNVKDFIRDFKAFSRPLLNIIAASPAVNQSDAAQFNLVPDAKRKKPTSTSTPIMDKVTAHIQFLGGGQLKITCRTISEKKRAHKHAHADSVQVAIKIGGDAPISEKDGTYIEIFSKAKFLLELGTENVGKKIYLFFRWYNVKHPGLASGWGEMQACYLA